MRCKVGLIGLGSMGTGLAKNLSANGISVAVWDKDVTISLQPESKNFANPIVIHSELYNLLSGVDRPRQILLSVPSGPSVDQVLDKLLPHLSVGDLVADCGNSYFRDTARREKTLESVGVKFIGIGISGGPEGALKGPSIAVGGDKRGWQQLQAILYTIACKSNGSPCCEYFGKGGSGHFVKMVHNGIEYAIMHILMEAYEIIKRFLGGDSDKAAQFLEKMNNGLIAGYLMKISAHVAAKRDSEEGRFIVDVVSGKVDQNGTGQWSLITALEQGVAAPTLAEAVMYRLLSERFEQNKLSPQSGVMKIKQRRFTVEQMSNALTCAFLSAFAQGLSIINSCETSLGHALDEREILRIWRGGCILQGEIVEFLWQNAKNNHTSNSVIKLKPVNSILKKTQNDLRFIASSSILNGVPIPGLTSALAYVESLTGNPLPTAFLQLQRNFFGQHNLVNKETEKPYPVFW